MRLELSQVARISAQSAFEFLTHALEFPFNQAGLAQMCHSKQAILPVIYAVQKGVGILNRFSNRVENNVESTGCENRVNNIVSYLYF